MRTKQNSSTPEIRLPDENHMIMSASGIKLFTKRNLPQGPKATVVITHGLAEHLGRYDYLANYLVRHNFAVYRFDQRGHGHSEGVRGDYSDYSEFADDVNTIVQWAKYENGHLPVFVLGHSMGGSSVMAFGTKYPDLVTGIICSSGLSRYNRHLFGENRLFNPESDLKNSLGSGVNSDQRVIDAYNRDPLVLKSFKGSLANAILQNVDYLKKNAINFVDPVLILHGAEDGLIDPLDSWQSWSEIGSKDKELHIYPFLMHEILNEPSRKNQIYDEIINWMERHFI